MSPTEYTDVQSRYSALFERSLDCVFLMDLQGRFLDANPAALDLVGYTRECIPGVNLRSLLEPADLALAATRIEELKATGHSGKPAEFKVRCKDGRLVDVESRSAVILHDGTPVAIMGIARDITDRKRMDERLRESEEKFRTLVESMNAAVGIVQGSRFVYTNEHMAKMLGYSADEIRSMDFPQLVHPDFRAQMIEWARRRLAGEEAPGNYEFIAVTKSGEHRWIDFSPARMIYRGQPAIIGTGYDITEHKRREQSLQRSEERLRLLSDTATRLLTADDARAALLDVFDKTADHLGAEVYFNYLLTADGKRLHLHASRGLDEATAQKFAFIEFGQPFCGIVAQQRRRMTIDRVSTSVFPGTDVLRGLGLTCYACHPLLDGGVLGTVAFCSRSRDCFDEEELGLMRAVADQASMALLRQRLTEQLEQRAASLDDANRSKDRFLAVLSHELRTPLTPVLTTASMLEEDATLPPQVREDLAMIRRNVELESRLIDDLLDVTRIVRGKIELTKQPVLLMEVIRRAVEVCRADIDARHLEFGVDEGDAAKCVIQADIGRLQQVFWNLLKNAIKFTPHGGCVGIRCWRDGADHVIARVSDSGEGIDPAVLPHVFEPFEQGGTGVTRQFGGLGLGLTISKGLLEIHGGSISAFSRGKGMGASFSVRLPLLHQAVAPVGSARDSGTGLADVGMDAASAARPAHILLVEDHGDTARIMKRLLSQMGHHVETAGDVAGALQRAGSQPFDLLISDLGLPDGSGIDLMRELRKRGNPLPGIALSGYAQEADVRRSHEAGFVAHVTKPVSLPRLLEVIASVTSQNDEGRRD